MVGEKKIFKDQMGFNVEVAWPPKRIISLVPSQTELLAYLGMDNEVVGITKFCVHPQEWFKNKKRIGGTKNIDLNKIEELQPDVIIGNKEENKEEQIKELMQRYPVWMSDIHNLNDAFDMILNVGKLVNKYDKADVLVKNIRSNFKSLHSHEIPARAAYFIWREPYMSVGKSAFISNMMEMLNLHNVFAAMPGEYPVVTTEQIKQAEPEIILLSSEPYPFAEKHKAEFKEICPSAKIMLTDGEYFSWYGSRLLNAPAYFNAFLSEVNNA